MAIDTTIYVRAPGRISAYLDWLQMLTGVSLILFMWSHMVLVASINLGPNAMNTLARFFEDTYMAQVGGPMVGFAFLLHFLLAARKIPFRMEQQSTVWKHSRIEGGIVAGDGGGRCPVRQSPARGALRRHGSGHRRWPLL